jgi:hypothetical protein
MHLDDNPAFGDGSEELGLSEVSLVVEVKEFEGLEEEGVDADLGGAPVLQFVEQFCLEAR